MHKRAGSESLHLLDKLTHWSAKWFSEKHLDVTTIKVNAISKSFLQLPNPLKSAKDLKTFHYCWHQLRTGTDMKPHTITKLSSRLKQIRHTQLFTAGNTQCLTLLLHWKADTSENDIQHDASSFWQQTDRGVQNTALKQRHASLMLSQCVEFFNTGFWESPFPISAAVVALLFRLFGRKLM